MPKITDQEFDNLFREAAIGIAPRQEQGDWQEMERRLDVAERDARARNISLYAVLGLLLLYSFLVPNDMKPGQTDRASVLPDIANVDGTESTTRSLPVEMRAGAKEKRDGALVQTPLNEKPLNAQSLNAQSLGNALADEGSLNENTLSKGPSNEPRLNEVTEQTDASRQTESPPLPTQHQTISIGTEPSPPAHGMPVAAQNNPSLREGLPASGAAVTGPVPVSSRLLKDRTPSTESLYAVPESQLQVIGMSAPGRIVDVKAPARHPLFIKLAVSPDFSSIDYGGSGKTGINLGPMIEYGITPRLSISGGILWSKKVYDQKDPEKSYGNGGVSYQANMLDADCRIIDIPLNVTYYMFPGRKTNLFVTLGTSSYLMLDEMYVYTVSRYSHDYKYVEKYANGNMEWFSMLNLSAGLQHQMGPRWFLQAEPFLKAPMKGVGEGKVNLVSTGVFVSIKYWMNPR